jgi:hypothetical protein
MIHSIELGSLDSTQIHKPPRAGATAKLVVDEVKDEDFRDADRSHRAPRDQAEEYAPQSAASCGPRWLAKPVTTAAADAHVLNALSIGEGLGWLRWLPPCNSRAMRLRCLGGRRRTTEPCTGKSSLCCRSGRGSPAPAGLPWPPPYDRYFPDGPGAAEWGGPAVTGGRRALGSLAQLERLPIFRRECCQRLWRFLAHLVKLARLWSSSSAIRHLPACNSAACRCAAARLACDGRNLWQTKQHEPVRRTGSRYERCRGSAAAPTGGSGPTCRA